MDDEMVGKETTKMQFLSHKEAHHVMFLPHQGTSMIDPSHVYRMLETTGRYRCNMIIIYSQYTSSTS